MKALITVTDIYTGVERKFPSWVSMASYVITQAVESNNYTRFLPACNNWNLDYPNKNESAKEYRLRMIDMAAKLQLVGKRV